MSLSSKTKHSIAELLIITIRRKLESYKPETVHMPFHHRVLGKDRYAMFSFIHSMNTTFGMSLFEQLAVILSQGAGHEAQRNYKLLGQIDDTTERFIRELNYELRGAKLLADKEREIQEIRKLIKQGERQRDPDSTVDLFVKIGNQENYFDITTAKPNIKEFGALKLKLLRWTALRLSQDNDANVFTRLAIPYNPYHPEPYERWTLQGLYDLESEILVGEEFWNFVASGNVYEEVLDVFEQTGLELRDEIDRKFAELARTG